jgi:hypothetical protein
MNRDSHPDYWPSPRDLDEEDDASPLLLLVAGAVSGAVAVVGIYIMIRIVVWTFW